MAFQNLEFYRFTFRKKAYPGRTFHGCGWSDPNEFVARKVYEGIINGAADNEPFNPSIDVVKRSTHEEVERIKRENDAEVVASGGQTVEELTDGNPGALLANPIPAANEE